MTPQQRDDLDRQGYATLEGFMSAALLEELRAAVDGLFQSEGESAGSEFKQEPGARRLANLVDKGEIFRRIIDDPQVLEAVRSVLGRDIKLSSLNARSANPHSDCRQPLHADAGAVADERGYWVCNTVWMLDDFTTENGALRVIPGSHTWRRVPPPGTYDPRPDERLVTAPAGTVVVMNAHMWHGATDNRTARQRRAVHAFYCRRDKPQQQYQKSLLRPETQAKLTPELRELLALDDPLNDELCTTGAGASGFMK
ncbi:MAG TPA: phytanoyl-CoA dioxygenase family protein [Bryobacteraceae bacterium]|jgi:ectoine hydroxylase-related dioxygenase (phytanoyl-CoA dioxygenase family)